MYKDVDKSKHYCYERHILYIHLKIYYKDMSPREAKHCYQRKTYGMPLCGRFSIMLYRDLCELPAVIEFDLLIASFPFPNKKIN